MLGPEAKHWSTNVLAVNNIFSVTYVFLFKHIQYLYVHVLYIKNIDITNIILTYPGHD